MTDNDDRPAVIRASAYASTALDALLATTQLDAIRGQDAHEALGELKYGLGDRTPAALTNLTKSLARSLDVYDVRQDDGTDPAVAIANATDHLQGAATALEVVWDHLEAAQLALRGQAAHDRDEK
jgi:hypothetical protein